MICDQVREQLGAHLDGELSPDDRASIIAHLAECDACRQDSNDLRHIASELASTGPVDVPNTLWTATQRRLGSNLAAMRKPRGRWMHRRPFAAAAGFLLLVGLGTILFTWPDNGAGRAEAATINFGIILDTLPLDAEKAFRDFLELYNAERIPVTKAEEYAPRLNFALPDTLEGGFQRDSVYGLRFGKEVGIAVRYSREGEFLMAVFHPTIHIEDHGVHTDYPCMIGETCGHKVQVADWALVHVTDPTTCHCILSRLDEETELPAVLTALAPPL